LPERRIEVDGKIVVDEGSAVGVTVVVEKNGKKVETPSVSSSGIFEFDLLFDADYLITFSKEGYVTKKLKFNTRAPQDVKNAGLMPFTMNILLHKPLPGADNVSMPYSTIRFVNDLNDFDYDKEEMRSISAQKSFLEPLKAEAKKREAEELKAKQEAIARRYAEEEAARKKAMAEEERNEKYRQTINQADRAFEAKDYLFAKNKYQEAMGIKPEENYPKEKLKKIEELEAAEVKEKETMEKYKLAMEAGDMAFANKQWQIAKQKYEEALQLKPSEQAPKEKIKQIIQILTEEQKAKEMEEKYKLAISQADKYFASKDFKNAELKYLEALKIKPENTYPAEQLGKITNILEEEAKKLAEEKERNENYQAAIQAADRLFTQGNFEASILKYREALNIKMNEAYPAQKIKEAEQASLNKQKQELEARLKNEKYEAAMKRGHEFLIAGKHIDARTAFSEALQVKPEDQTAKSKLREVEALLIEGQKLKEKLSRYKDAISRADQLLKSGKKTEALVIYKEASIIMPEESYPKEKIKQIEEEFLKEIEYQKRKIEEQKKLAEEEAKRKAALEEEIRKETARRKAEEEARRKAEEEARFKAEQEARAAAERKAKEEAEIKRKAEEERLLAEKKKKEEEQLRKREEEEKARLFAEEAARKMREELARKQAEEEARRRMQQEAESQLAAARKRQSDEERKRLLEAEQQERQRILADRHRRDEERRLTRLKQEMERRNMPYIVIQKFSWSTESMYGYVNLGDKSGSRDLNKEEFKMLLEKYKNVIKEK